jgi:hypothetical protein
MFLTTYDPIMATTPKLNISSPTIPCESYEKGGPTITMAGPVSKPAVSDIICGKDKTYAQHAGNQRFRQDIQDYVASYRSASNKQEKMNITKEIVYNLQINCSARFLKKVGSEWLEISDQNARDKTSHALRFAAGKHGSRSCKAKKNHRRHVSADTSTSSHPASSYSSTGSHVCVVLSTSPVTATAALSSDVTVVQNLFERQQAILTQFRKDLEEGGVSNEIDTGATAEVDPNKDDEFNTLRSEDLDRLMSEPLDDGEWDNILQLTR